jgi:hypothetical protein
MYEMKGFSDKHQRLIVYPSASDGRVTFTIHGESVMLSLQQWSELAQFVEAQLTEERQQPVESDLVLALVGLGYTKTYAQGAVQRTSGDNFDSRFREALKILSTPMSAGRVQ